MQIFQYFSQLAKYLYVWISQCDVYGLFIYFRCKPVFMFGKCHHSSVISARHISVRLTHNTKSAEWGKQHGRVNSNSANLTYVKAVKWDLPALLNLSNKLDDLAVHLNCLYNRNLVWCINSHLCAPNPRLL